MSHGREAERQSGKIASKTTNTTVQVKLAISNNINTEADITAIVIYNIDEALQSADGATDTAVSFRTA